MSTANFVGEALILLEFLFRVGLVIMILSRRRIEPATRLSWIILLLATLLSFFVNYLLSKFFVFQLALPPKSVSKEDGL